MIKRKRFSVVFVLASYLLATTAVHFLHDHSGLCHRGGQALCGATHGDEHAGHNGAPSDCEDSCFACRFLAAKSIAPAMVAVVVRVEIVRPFEFSLPVFTPAERPALPLSRGPPYA